MARSQDAMRKRAEKRNRTLPEQRKADSADMRKRLEEEVAVKKQRMVEHAHASMLLDPTPVGHYGPSKTPAEEKHANPNPKHLKVAQKAVAVAVAVAPMVKKEEKAAAAAAMDDKKEENVLISNTNQAASADTRTNTDTDTDTRTPYKRTNSTVHNKYGSKKIDPLSEQGSWKCPGCQNHNFASRSTCNSKTCSETRPADCLRPIQRHLQASQQHLIPSLQRQRPAVEPAVDNNNNNNNKRPAPPAVSLKRERESNSDSNSNSQRPFNNWRDKGGRHDVTTSKTQTWAAQSDNATLAQNRELRRTLAESPGGTGQGMDEQDVKRAQTLMARDERKKQKRQAKLDQKEERKQKQKQLRK